MYIIILVIIIMVIFTIRFFKLGCVKNLISNGSIYPQIKLSKERNTYKPFEYPECYEKWDIHEHSHWSFKELNMQDDVIDWDTRLTKSEKDFLTNVLTYFTQGDVDVAAGYVQYLQFFKQPEVRMMLLGFASRECMHIASYSHVNSTLNLPDDLYQRFMEFKAMKDKHDFLFDNKFRSNSTMRFIKFILFGYDAKLEEMAVKIALFSAFIEGVQLFSSFIMLLNFTRHGLMRKMGQIIQWSIADETHHTNSMIELYRTLVRENQKYIRLNVLEDRVCWTGTKIVELENSFIDLAFEMGPMRNLTADEVKQYVKFITDRRLITMGYKGIFHVKKNPLEWVEDMVNTPTHTNFFENKPTEYVRNGLTGDWPW